jgi:hypothetical protein
MSKGNKSYARVMHHIGGLSGNNDNSDMIRGGVDEMNLITEADIPAGTDIERLFKLGALREATADEVKQFEISKGIREADPDDKEFTDFTTGSAGLKSDPTKSGAVKEQNAGGAGEPSGEGDPASYKGMGKGELSEYTVPELKDFAKEAGIEGYATMLKPELLDALTGTQAPAA